jgi:hypothetical protein
MKKKVIGILILGILIATIFPCADATINKTDQKESTMVYESRIFGMGFVRINSFTQKIKGFVLFGINDGEIISMQLINIKYEEADELFAGFLPLMFFIRYNPAE